MKTLPWGISAIITVLSAMICVPVEAAPDKCSYRKSIVADGATFIVSSRPASGCNVQILDIVLQRKGKQNVRYRSDVDGLAYNMLAGDLNSDGVPELIVLSKNSRQPDYPVVDLYRLDGSLLRRTALAPPDDISEYRGGDSFWLDGNQVVRSFPLYGGEKQPRRTRTLKYEMIDNKLAVYVQSDVSEPVPETATPVSGAPAASVQPLSPPPAERKAAVATTLSDVVVGETGITIKTDGPIGTYKTMKLDKPERIAIDFPKGKNGLNISSRTVERFGITRVRIGNNKGFVRLVFDAKDKKFPLHTVKPVGDGLLVEFADGK